MYDEPARIRRHELFDELREQRQEQREKLGSGYQYISNMTGLESTDVPVCHEDCINCIDEFKIECTHRAFAAYHGEPYSYKGN